MIKIFRHIRKTLIDQNKMGKYLKYAIGEIVLVVIGILIALSINNWNQNRINQKQKSALLKNLHQEFVENKDILKNYKIRTLNEINALIALMELIGANREELLSHNLDSLFFSSLDSNELSFSENTFNNIIQSNQLSLFKNESIQELMNEWITLSQIRENRIEKSSSWDNNHFVPYLLNYVSFKEMDAHGGFRWTGKSKVKPDYYPLFQKVEFENYIENSLWYSHNILVRIEETELLINKIISASNPKSK